MAFATILAVVAGLTLTSASSVAHDLYATVIKKGQATEKDEVKVARIAAFVIGGIAIALAIPAQKLNIAFLVALAFAVAASANLPSIIYNMFWRRFNTRGATWAIYGGLISCVVLVFFSPVVSGLGVNPVTGASLSLFPVDVDFHWFPLQNPGIVSIPLGFFFGWLGHRDVQGAVGRGQVHRARGPRLHRCRRRAGHPPLSRARGHTDSSADRCDFCRWRPQTNRCACEPTGVGRRCREDAHLRVHSRA